MENVHNLQNMDLIYEYNRVTPSNIQPEMEMLYRYAKACEHITEFGFGRGKSSSALIAARPKKIVSYDVIDRYGIVEKWIRLATELNVDFVYIQLS